MKATLLLALAALLPAVLASLITSNVETTYGPVFGNLRDANGILSFKGIPFAQPPVGDLRWKSPSPPTPWNTAVNSTTFGPACWTFLAGGPPIGPQSENCLTANVWTGAQQTTELRPVMVFFYGGGFQFGSSSNPTYDGSKFAGEGVVLVSFNYRLGVFGFLALQELDSEGPNSGNFGLQDQIWALRWVKENIEAFGGNPKDILVFGESAGAHSIGLLMSSPLGQGAFDKAIIESGAWWDSEHGSINTFDQARQEGYAWATRMGAHSASTLRALSAQSIVNDTLYNIATDPALSAFGPSIDYYVVEATPAAVFEAGNQSHIPLLAGWNGDEGLLFAPRALPHNSAAQFQANLPLLFGGRTAQALNQPDLYPAHNDAEANASAIAEIGDLVIAEQTWEAADTQQKTGGSSVFVYYFTYNSSYSPVPEHTSELPFVFGTLIAQTENEPTAADRAFSSQIMGYWTNFAKSSNPNGAGLASWPVYRAGCADILQLGNSIAPIDYDLARFRFIKSFRNQGVLPTSWRSINVSEANP